MASDISDRDWFEANPEANQRVRPPRHGEVAEILTSIDPRIVGEVTDPPGASWQIRVVRVGRRHIWRDLLLRVDGAVEGAFGDALRLSTVTLGARAAVSKL